MFLMVSVLIIFMFFRVNIGVTLFITVFIASVLYSGSLHIIDLLIFTLRDHVSQLLMANVFLIAFFVSLYRVKGLINAMSSGFMRILRRDYLAITLIPGLIGLLPVPGGALLSAPIVDGVGDLRRLSRPQKLFVNVWYRHTILYFYPLSTTIIFTAAITNTSPWRLAEYATPIAFVMFLLGYSVLIGKKASSGEKLVLGEESVSSELRSTTPILATILISLALGFSGNPLLSNELYVIVSVSIGIILLITLNRYSLNDLLRSLRDYRLYDMVFLAYSLMLFRNFFRTIDLSTLGSELTRIGLDPLIITLSTPIVFSAISGHPTTGVGVSIPLLGSLNINMDLSTIMIVYTAAFLGYLGSPFHACYLYTANYLEISFVKGYKYLIPHIIITLVIGVILFKYILAL
ncbi:MAG: DUF401 family protein [Sulfolobales archaeon]